MGRSAVLVLTLVLAGCEPPPVWDTVPPRLVDTEVSADGKELSLAFDEPLAQAQAAIDEAPQPPPPVVTGPRVRVALPRGLKPGTGHGWSAEVADPGRNTTSVAGTFYPANLHPATLRLNEIRVAGSGVHTDFVELRVDEPGSLGGWTVEVWSGPDSHQRTILPDAEGAVGDLVVVRYREPGSDTAPGARELFQTGAKGLPATKGLVVLRRQPDGPPVDGLLYAKKSGDGAPLALAAGWEGPELDPSGCTATRTWCRTDGPNPAWMVVANGAATPGGPNKLIPWAGPPASRGPKPRTRRRMNHHRGAR